MLTKIFKHSFSPLKRNLPFPNSNFKTAFPSNLKFCYSESFKSPKLPPEPTIEEPHKIFQAMNKKVLKREIFNDMIQLPLKSIAFFSMPASDSSPFYAELIRSGIDTINHLALYWSSYVEIKPSKRFPYGLPFIAYSRPWENQ